MMKKPYFLTKIRWFGYTFATIGLVTASYIAVNYNEISLRPETILSLILLLLLLQL